MNKRPLEQLFFATYRGKQNFDEFLNLDLNTAFIKKSFDGRSVYSPEKNLKLYLGFLGRILFNRLPIEAEVVYSYRKGVNVVNAVEKHCFSRYFFQADIENFFGTITRDTIRNTILAAIDSCPISDIDQWLERILDIVTIDGLLPPGFPTSPAISNACLVEFDKKLLSWCGKKNLVYTRYADDLIVSGLEEDNIHLLSSHITELLDTIFNGQMRLNPSKTRVIRPGAKIKILGIAILPNGKVSVDGKLKKNAETAMHYLLKDRDIFASFLKEKDLEKALKKFSGQLNYINTVDPSFLDKLRKKYGATAVDKIIHVSVGS